ncbi:hypothetical protein BDV95DRAFT_258203 [Massariosphaeria phaeospora]|uniref:Uncharacterized protein n=1 Tax=Massariosphaeria phaeospora TaxID=100035 RepID=A0A7C8M274_9PLEO|nr:hypothetical protein BDV95DRAFT_258203 [Massariosphaeria phaeospora]
MSPGLCYVIVDAWGQSPHLRLHQIPQVSYLLSIPDLSGLYAAVIRCFPRLPASNITHVYGIKRTADPRYRKSCPSGVSSGGMLGVTTRSYRSEVIWVTAGTFDLAMTTNIGTIRNLCMWRSSFRVADQTLRPDWDSLIFPLDPTIMLLASMLGRLTASTFQTG